jgi:hypothetical protein
MGSVCELRAQHLHKRIQLPQDLSGFSRRNLSAGFEEKSAGRRVFLNGERKKLAGSDFFSN